MGRSILRANVERRLNVKVVPSSCISYLALALVIPVMIYLHDS